jgi:ribonuclease PH
MTEQAENNNPIAEITRINGRLPNQMRPVSLDVGYARYAEGSCLVKFGDTQVLCVATIENKVPDWLRGKKSGWITAEYGMLPRATHSRTRREARHGQTGRSQEIQRLVGRALRAAVDCHALGERQIIVDCDVIQADGGTRTAAITGGFVAVYQAVKSLESTGLIPNNTIITRNVAALSCVISGGNILVDPDYAEDSSADVDANFVVSDDGHLIEIQASAEKNPFSPDQLHSMVKITSEAIQSLTLKQKEVLQSL